MNVVICSTTSNGGKSMVSVYDYSKARKVVDVGGGAGEYLNLILSRHPGVKGILYDVPSVVNVSKSFWEKNRSDKLQRTEFIGGTVH